jgi:hypothetical protein
MSLLLRTCLAGSLVALACSAKSSSGGVAGGAGGAGSAGVSSAGMSSAPAGSGAAGATAIMLSGAAGIAGGSAGGGGDTGGAGTSGASGVSGASDGGSAGASGSGPDGSAGATISASCAGSSHLVCIDFEDGKVSTPWTLPASNAQVETGNAAHGKGALHLSNLHSLPKNGSGQPAVYLQTKLSAWSDVLWGRFYLYMDPGAPVGHGALVRANDSQSNWDEVGFESNGADPTRANDHSPQPGAYFADWHTGAGGNPEKYMRSQHTIPQKAWACVEFYFDGATPALPKVWGDGSEIVFDDIGGPVTAPQKAVHFESFEIGIDFYHGGSLITYEGDTAPYLDDEWLVDIALDTTRIGCL